MARGDLLTRKIEELNCQGARFAKRKKRGKTRKFEISGSRVFQ
jgi:hypothetical protein